MYMGLRGVGDHFYWFTVFDSSYHNLNTVPNFQQHNCKITPTPHILIEPILTWSCRVSMDSGVFVISQSIILWTGKASTCSAFFILTSLGVAFPDPDMLPSMWYNKTSFGIDPQFRYAFWFTSILTQFSYYSMHNIKFLHHYYDINYNY